MLKKEKLLKRNKFTRKYETKKPSQCDGFLFHLSRWRDSNPRPADYKSAALAS